MVFGFTAAPVVLVSVASARVMLDYQDVLDNLPASSVTVTFEADEAGLLLTLLAAMVDAAITDDCQPASETVAHIIDEIRSRAMSKLF